MNLYFPDAWMMAAQRTIQPALVTAYAGKNTQPITPAQRDYITSVAMVDETAWAYIVGRSMVAAGLPTKVPAWVYTQTRSPYTNGGK